MCCQPVWAADLVDVYCDAYKCDPTFRAAMAELLANRENIPINRGALLPRLDIHAEAERQKIKLDGFTFNNLATNGVFVPTVGSITFYNNHVEYCLKLSQPVFNYTNWAKLQQAKASVKQAEASFCASAQQLITRVARAYFDVLIADANLFYTRAQKKAVFEQLRQTKIQFEVGVVPKTDVYEAQANYDLIISQEISDIYALAQKVDALGAITGKFYGNLKGLNAYLPLIKPEPENINAWVCAAERQNYRLLAARFAALAACQNIKVQFGDRFPDINTFGEFEYRYDSNYLGSGVLNRQQILEGGVELNFAPIQGGAIHARTLQAQYLYRKACHDQEFTHRQIVSDARNAYLGIFAEIARINADFASIRSSLASLNATTESYKVGVRTILDVLNQETQLYNAQKNFAKDRYDYLYQTILLKQAAGTLCVADLQHMNAWFYNRIDLSKPDALLQGCTTLAVHR